MKMDNESNPPRKRKMSATERAKRSFRLDHMNRACLTFELITTNKTHAYLAAEFGISRQAVSRFCASIRTQIAEGNVRIRFYRRNGELMFSTYRLDGANAK